MLQRLSDMLGGSPMAISVQSRSSGQYRAATAVSPTPSEKSERSCSLENFGGATSLLVASSSNRVLNNEVKFMRQDTKSKSTLTKQAKVRA